MSSIKPQTLKGFRDFLPQEARKRQYVIDILKKVFESYGFEPLETPVLEYASTLLDKYGPEADKLTYKFMDRGNREVGMRYDLTVPFSRVVAQYQNELPIPFKRYQIAPVWRADKPQAGRFREFWQADIDIVGSSSIMSDAEIVSCIFASMKIFGFEKYRLLINDRNIFQQKGIREIKIIRDLDKLPVEPDKFPGDEIATIFRRERSFSQQEAEKFAREFFLTDEPESISKIREQLKSEGVDTGKVIFLPWLARGLEYYTGVIFELQIVGYKNLSIGGGGRYDELIGKFAGRDLSAVGFSFGIDRLTDAMTELKLFPDDLQTTKVLVTVFGKEFVQQSLNCSLLLRSSGVSTELYLDENASLEKQLKYADKKGIPFAIIIGPDEAKKDEVTLKNLITKTQEKVSIKQAIDKLKYV